jgi:hypothetical protein
MQWKLTKTVSLKSTSVKILWEKLGRILLFSPCANEQLIQSLMQTTDVMKTLKMSSQIIEAWKLRGNVGYL